MANKDAVLKKRLIRNGIILAVTLVIFGIGAYILSDYSDDMQTEQQSKATELSNQRGELNAIDTLLKTGTEVNNYYKAYILTHNSDFFIQRDAATKVFTELREKFHLATLGVSIEHIDDVQGDFAQIKSGTLVKSEVKLTFTALTDNSVFGFIEALHHELPGIVVMSSLKITRGEDLSRAILMDLSQHKITPMVSGELAFTWLGIRPKSTESSDSTNGKKAK